MTISAFLACHASPSSRVPSLRCNRLGINAKWWHALCPKNPATQRVAPDRVFVSSNGDLVTLITQFKRKFALLREIPVRLNLHAWSGNQNQFASSQSCHLLRRNQCQFQRHPPPSLFRTTRRAYLLKGILGDVCALRSHVRAVGSEQWH